MKRSKSKIENHQQDGDVDDSYAVQRQQQDDVDGDYGLTVFSKALLNLSFNDRNMIEEEMHGVSCMAIDETPELIEESLYQFDLELDLIEHKVAYNKAQETMTSNHSYLLDKDIKLRFLRSELFDPSKSALRYTKYLDLLFEIYGECALQRPIRIEDFNHEELSFFKSGLYQLLPFRDRCGRRILAVVSNKKDHIPRNVIYKVFLYLWFVCVGGSDTSNNDRNSLETQQKGVVVVYFPNPQVLYNSNENDSKKKDWKERLEANHRISKCVPIRVVAVHLCLPNSYIFKLLASVYGAASKGSTTRTKIHIGNPIEIRYKLQQFGIPIGLLPTTDTGNIKSVYFKQWINLRAHLEHGEQTHMINNSNSTPASSYINYNGYHSEVVSTPSPPSHLLYYLANTNNIIVECPSSNDVIFRRGKPMNIHSGNVKFQNVIESYIYEHSIDPNTPLLRRKEIEIEILNEVLKPKKNNGSGRGDSGGRFLTWNIEKKWWVVIHSEDEIQLKIYHAFLGFRKKMLKAQQQQQKVQTVTNLNSIFERQQDGQKKKWHNKNKNKNCGCCSDCGLYCGSDDNNSKGCSIMPSLPSFSTVMIEPSLPAAVINIGNNKSSDCGYFFSTDDGSYACADFSYNTTTLASREITTQKK